MDASLSTTLLHAITFLLTPLAHYFQPQTLDTLHLALLSSLSESRTHTLTFDINYPPPKPIQTALNALSCLPPAYRVSWRDWIILLSRGNQLVLNIAPGFVHVATNNAMGAHLSHATIWDASMQRRAPSPWGSTSRSRSSAPSSAASSGSASDSSRSSTPSLDAPVVPSPAVAVSAAENVLRGLEDDDDIVFLGRQPSSANPWASPESKIPSFSHPLSHRPNVQRPTRSEYQQHSRSSSRSSNVSTSPSLVSCSTGPSPASLAHTLSALTLSSRGHSRASSSSLSLALSNASTLSSSPEPPSPTPSDDENTCYIDASKNQNAVTEYECGKVGVLTGAVMLGVPSGGKAKPVAAAASKMSSKAPVFVPQPARGGQPFRKHTNNGSISSPNAWRKSANVVRI